MAIVGGRPLNVLAILQWEPFIGLVVAGIELCIHKPSGTDFHGSVPFLSTLSDLWIFLMR